MKGKTTEAKVDIPAPNLQVAEFRIVGDAPYVQQRFSEKAKAMMKDKQEAGSTGKKGAKREAKDFEALCEAAKYLDKKGRCGIPAACFRSAMISACRMTGFAMTRAKLSLFVLADSADKDDETPMVLFTKGEPHYSEHHVRLETGVADIRPRPMWSAGWEVKLRVRFDADQFTTQDVAHVLMRAGLQVGVGEGRPDSKKSNGCGWGTFEIKN